MWYLVFVRARNTSPAKRVGNLKEKDPHRLVRDRAWFALRSVGAGARACPRHPFARAACARVACTVTLCLVGARARASVPGTHIVRGGPVLGQARVFPALGHARARARAASARVAREFAVNASIACRAMVLQSALSLTPVCWASQQGCARVAKGREPRQRNRPGLYDDADWHASQQQANPHWALDKQVRAMQSHVFVNIIPLH